MQTGIDSSLFAQVCGNWTLTSDTLVTAVRDKYQCASSSINKVLYEAYITKNYYKEYETSQLVKFRSVEK